MAGREDLRDFPTTLPILEASAELVAVLNIEGRAIRLKTLASTF